MMRFWAFSVLWFFLGLHPCEAKFLDSFDGNVDFINKKFDVSLRFNDGSFISAQSLPTSANDFSLTVKIDHLKTKIFEISTLLKAEMRTAEDSKKQHFLKGTVESRYSLISRKPAREMAGSFEIRNNRIYLYSVSWGDMVIDGYIGLSAPFETDLILKFNDMSGNDFFMLTGCSEDLKMPSLVSGHIQLTGLADKIFLKGGFVSYTGIVGDLKYDNLMINFEGIYPKVRIIDSKIIETDGLSFNLEGEYDLTKKCDPEGALSGLRASPLIDDTALHTEWTIKEKKQSETSSTGLKYLLKKETDKDLSGQDSGMLGVEHTIKF